jgi:hypothetical protein
MGLGELVPYIPCPCPDIVTNWQSIPPEQLPSPPIGWASQVPCIGLAGFADYLPGFQFPVPQSLAPGGGGLADYLPGFAFPVPQSLAAGGKGLADISQATAPGGLFSTLDVTQWGWGEWVVVFGGLYFVGSLLGDTKRAARKTVAAGKAAGRAFRGA